MFNLDGKVAIVTGAAQGMGESHARKLIGQGAKVVLTDLNEEKGSQVAKELGDNALFIKHDVTDEDGWKKVVSETLAKWGKIDVLVNNAGITVTKSIDDTTEADYLKVFQINQLSVFLGMKYVSPEMIKNKQGSIINISSINGLVGAKIGYTDTKFAVRGMTKAAALELAQYNIRVNSIHPGAIATPMVMQEDTRAAVEQFAKMIPLGRLAEPEEVSGMVVYLASDESRYSTGSEFVVDGGITAQ
ncbi:glucose 1-dehydrogenase [Lactobacillus sp. YT155]|uniref:glucose 1-dehydrogenase n=1 Tax=Lactobacillus sp. YT155 TaxID=3060955 RepID=UPI00265D6F01|nr:glucose 1-dehydrogenase [Lactobacillus sp. YT155]MDO1604513.1 glucose 1-dehydrogenase [Lactobacillus sp. YT155]